jgi:hypothetical protein
VVAALELVCPDWTGTARRQWPVTTPGKPWDVLSMLLYEAVTGEDNSSTVRMYMRQFKRHERPLMPRRPLYTRGG